MCGICGILATSGGFARIEATVDAMRDVLRTAAPTTPERGIAGRPRGARPSAAVDRRPLAGGPQPMPNEDETVWITYNGEIYNHDGAARRSSRRKRPRLSRRTPTPRRSSTSTRRRAPRCVERLDGMFAFAIWDARAARAVPRARPPRHQAALLRAAGRRLRLRVGDQGAARAPGGRAGPRRGGVPPLPDLRLHAGAADDVRGHLEARARPSA